MESGMWCLLRGKADGEKWASSEATPPQLEAWSDLPAFEHYMGAMPFPYDIGPAMQHYELAAADAASLGVQFSHHYYATGFLEAVYEFWQGSRPGP